MYKMFVLPTYVHRLFIYVFTSSTVVNCGKCFISLDGPFSGAKLGNYWPACVH